MSRIISANKLNRFWKNGIIPIKNNLNNKIKTKADLMANTVEGYVPDALAVKEGLKEINDSLGTVKTATCSLIGMTTEGELSYTANTVKYVLFGSLIFVNYQLVVDGVITHPEGNFRIKLNIPELIDRPIVMDAGGNITYARGGYKECIRRMISTDLYTNGLMDGRILAMTNKNFDPSVQGTVFVNDVTKVTESNGNLHLIDENGNVDVQIKGTFFAMLY